MNIRTRIKVCGMTTIKEAEEAVNAGVDALGFIFAESSPRYVNPEKVKEIVKKLPPFVDAVGVFVDEEAEVVDETTRGSASGVIPFGRDGGLTRRIVLAKRTLT